MSAPPGTAWPGGLPIAEQTAREAAEWLTLLMSGEASEEERAAWRRWRAADAEHERAWRHIEAAAAGLRRQFPGAQAAAARHSLSGVKSAGRRRAFKALALLGMAGGAAMLAARTEFWRTQVADYRTASGEQRRLTLADGTEVLLDTASAIDVHFDRDRRLVRLIAGQVLIATAHEAARPFVVATAEGRARALGTRFTVRQADGRSSVAVFEGAVALDPADGPGERVLEAGQTASFTRRIIEPVEPLREETAAWARGQLVADELRLDAFLAELGRYRAGILACDPAVADLRLSGVFPLGFDGASAADTDRILAALPNSLPVRVRYRTRYWVRVEPR